MQRSSSARARSTPPPPAAAPQLFFETFRVRALYLAPPATLALFAVGKLTGVVVDIGDTSTHVVALHDGRPLAGANIMRRYGGRDLTAHLMTEGLKGAARTWVARPRIRITASCSAACVGCCCCHFDAIGPVRV